MTHYLTKQGFLLTSHPQAPLYVRENPETLFGQVVTEAANPTEGVRELMRQTALVSLWFFEKYVAGYNGPFNLINTDLHLDMTNFRQRCLEPGIKGAVFAPRFVYKTTTCTTGADPWEVIRDPEICIGLYHGVEEEAMDFLAVMQRIFDSNEFFAWLFPEFHVENARTQPRWNAHELVVPCRTRFYKEANIEVGSVGGSSQGRHYDVWDLDDIIGETDLDANRGSAIDMERKRGWFRANQKALLRDWNTSRIIIKATRYAPDDVYEDIMMDVGAAYGYWNEIDYAPKPDGRWTVYYRQGIEDGKSIFPERMPLDKILQQQKDDWWSYATWTMNNPKVSGIAEFTTHTVGKVTLTTHDDAWYVVKINGDEIAFADCDVIQAGDPAGSEKRKDARTSRSAQNVTLQDYNGHFYVVSLHVGYVPITTFFDWLFDDWERFKKYIRITIPEAQGAFKIIDPLLRKERRLRGKEMNYLCKPKTGEKDAVIRLAVLPLLKAGKLHVVEAFHAAVMEEVNGFPGSNKKDILDTIAIAVNNSVRPENPEEAAERYEAQERFRRRRTTNITGY